MKDKIEKLISLFHQKKYLEAINLAENLFKKDKKNPFYFNFMGNVYQAKGQIDLSIVFFERALEIDSNFFYALYNLGISYKKKNLIQKSKEFFIKAIEKKDDYYDAINNLGLLYDNNSEYLEAIRCFEKCIKINPSLIDAYVNISLTYAKVGLTDKAIQSCTKALEIDPKLYGVYNNLGLIYHNINQEEKALKSYLKAIQIKPDYIDGYNNIGINFILDKKFTGAIEFLDKAISFDNSSYKSIQLKAIALQGIGNHQDAISLSNESLKINPNYHTAYVTMSESYIRMMDYNNFMKTVDLINPDLIVTQEFGQILYNYCFHNKFSSARYLSFAKAFRSKIKNNVLELNKFNYNNSKKIRIGFVSEDFREHAVTYQLKDFFKILGDDKDFETFAFSNNKPDNLTLSIKNFFFEFKDCRNLSNLDLANYIRNKGIHILIDLSGFTKGSKLSMFAYKPSPIQLSWCGWLASTGLDEMDYLIGDRYVFPENSNFENNYTEKIIKMDNCWSILSSYNEVDFLKTIPSKSNKYITFGSFNNFLKYNDLVIEVWSKILHKVEDSKIFLCGNKIFSETSFVDLFFNRFKKYGISKDRIILEGLVSRKKLMENYNKVDIVLDPFPYTGGTTNLEAASMCLPIVTLEGDSLLSRCGVSVNCNRGLDDWNCKTIEEYVEKAVKYSNSDFLQKIKDRLAQEKKQCPLFSAEILKKDFKKKMLEIFSKKFN